MTMLAKIRKYILKPEIEALEKALKRIERLEAANEFFIAQGKRFVQYQINNPESKSVPSTLMGHGLQLGADHLGLTSKQWAKSYRAETKAVLAKLNKDGKIARHMEAK